MLKIPDFLSEIPGICCNGGESVVARMCYSDTLLIAMFAK